jgi:hypothetical protein
MSFFQHIPGLNQNTTAKPFPKKAPPKVSKGAKTASKGKSVSTNPSSTAQKNPFIKKLAPGMISRPAKTTKQIRESSEAIDAEACDILFIDDQIQKKLRTKISTLPELQNTLSNLLWIMQHSSDNLDRSAATLEAKMIRKSMQDIEGGFDLALYILRTSDILEEYKTILARTRTNSFVQTRVNIDIQTQQRKASLKSDFLRIARNYINLENLKQKTQKMICGECYGTSFGKEDEDSIMKCKGCGQEIDLLDDAPSFKDAERVNMSSRYTYTCRGHFIEAMNRFEGKQNTEINQNVIDTLEKELRLHNLDPKTSTKDHIYMFLSEKKLSDYYADINLIFFKITGINPPDITKYRNELLEMHDQLEQAYQEVKDSERLNSLNVNWKLYKLLQLLDYPCRKDDFFCLKTPTKQGEHEQKWYDMIEYLKIKYPNAKTSAKKPRWRHVRTL